MATSPALENKNHHAIYELNVTVTPFNPDRQCKERFAALCQENELKPIDVGVIYVSKGFKRFQQTGKYFTGNYNDAIAQLKKYVTIFKDTEFKVIRTKIEAAASSISSYNPDGLEDNMFFENHIVVQLPFEFYDNEKDDWRDSSDNIIQKLNDLNDKYGHKYNVSVRVPLSFNMKKIGNKECFLTFRGYSMTKSENDCIVQQIQNDLINMGLVHIKTIKEVVCFDDNNDLDSESWVTPVTN